MRNFILRAALCGILITTTSSASAPETLHVRSRVALPLVKASVSTLLDSHWVDAKLAEMYPKPVWPPVPDSAPQRRACYAAPSFVCGSPPDGPRADFEYHKSLVSSCKTYDELYEQAISFIKFHKLIAFK